MPTEGGGARPRLHPRASAGRQSRLGRLLTLALITTTGLMSAGVANASAKTALIDASTVSGGAGSQEARIAAADGYTVNLVSDSTWGSMKQADFAQYDLLIAGDPSCGGLPGGLVSSAGQWGPVVLGKAGGRTVAGNRTLVGTDPVFHDGGSYSAPGARGTVIRDGIAFAGQQPGTTGMYLDVSCAGPYGQSSQVASAAQAISQGTGSWSVNNNPPCGGNVSVIASNPAFNDLTDASLAGWRCSVHETFPTFPSDWSALAVATDTATKPTCGNDQASGANACGQAYVLVAGSGVVVRSGSISMTPPDNTSAAGGDATVTAHLTSGASPLTGQAVTFSVTGQNAGASGTCYPTDCKSDASGDVTFTYHDANGAGDDTIKGSFTDARGSLQAATAAQHWTKPTEQAITASGTTGSTGEGQTFSGPVATITDPDTNASPSEYSAVIDWGDGSSTTAGTVTGSGGAFTVSGSHPYAEDGSYSVKVTISDNDSPANGASASTTMTVSDAALTAGSTSVTSSTENGSTTSSASFGFTDANPNATVSDFSATINWGDGSSSNGTVSAVSGGGFAVNGGHTYAEEGSYKVTVSVNDTGGQSTSGNATASVADAALTAGSASVSPGNEGAGASNASFGFTDANPTADAGDFSATINWGDGSSSTGTVSAASGGGFTVNGSHTYAEEGGYKATVTVNDTGGQSTSADASATVTDAALTAGTLSASGGTEGTGGGSAAFSFTDANPNAPASDFSATVDWGDGSSSTGTVSQNADGSFSVAAPGHTYAEEGQDTVKVSVTDKGGSTTSASQGVTVADASLTAGQVSVSKGTEGTHASNVAFGFADANPGATVSDFSATINWGDGSSSNGTVSAVSGGGFAVNGSHTYAEEGSYKVTVLVNDTGGQSTSGSSSATVDDASLTAAGTSMNSGPAYSGTVATFADADPKGTVSDYSATVDWGDGKTSAGTVSAVSGGFAVSGSHTYAQTGPYTIRVHITDAGGATADATSQILVYAFAAGNGGTFTIGDKNGSVGSQVTYWGSQWASANSLSSGSAPSSFKGFADSPSSNPSVCGGTYATGPGNSSRTPASVPAYMAVIVSSSISKQGSSVSGDVRHVVVVKTDAGYQADPGHAGTGKVVAVIC